MGLIHEIKNFQKSVDTGASVESAKLVFSWHTPLFSYLYVCDGWVHVLIISARRWINSLRQTAAALDTGGGGGRA